MQFRSLCVGLGLNLGCAEARVPAVRRVLVFLFCLCFPLSGAISVWADCFKHTHTGLQQDHHDAAHRPDTGDHAEHQSSAVIHCSEAKLAVDAATTSSTLLTSNSHRAEYRITLPIDISKEQNPFSLGRHFPGTSPPYLFLQSLPPYLVLSVFRI